MVEERLLRIARLAGVEVDVCAADLDPRLRLGREAEFRVLGRRLPGPRRKERDVIEVVVDVRVRLDEPEPQALVHVEEGAAVLARDVDALEAAERRLQVVHTERHVLQRTALAGGLGVEQRQLPATRVRADERELVRPLDHVHREPFGHELRDRLSVGDPERHVVESLGPHPGFHPTYVIRNEAQTRFISSD